MYHLSQPTQIESLFALGEYLRDVRESQRITIEAASQKLHIRIVYLKALESGDWSDLPGQAYGRGYLRQYAQFLGLSTEEIMKVLENIQGKVSSRLHYFETESTEQTPSRATLWLAFSCIFFLIAGWYFMQDDTTESLDEDYTIPADLLTILTDQSAVVPSPYPVAAQECLKLLQPVEHPCYRKQEAKQWPVLAKKMDFIHYD